MEISIKKKKEYEKTKERLKQLAWVGLILGLSLLLISQIVLYILTFTREDKTFFAESPYEVIDFDPSISHISSHLVDLNKISQERIVPTIDEEIKTTTIEEPDMQPGTEETTTQSDDEFEPEPSFKKDDKEEEFMMNIEKSRLNNGNVQVKNSALDVSRVVAVGCLNISTSSAGGKQVVMDRGLFVRACDDTGNQCSMNICNATTGQCEPKVRPGFECANQIDCGTGALCNPDTCMCQLLPNSTVGCTTDGECNIVNNVCRNFFCNVNGTCEQQILKGGNCWVDSDCQDPTRFCNTTVCVCEDKPIPPCTTADECPRIMGSGPGMCAAFECNSGICDLVPASGNECWQNGDCDFDTEVCNTNTCDCEPRFQTTCVDNSTCLNIDDRNVFAQCVTNACVNGTCKELNTIPTSMGGCWTPGQCTPNQFCNTTSCLCELRPVQQCQQASDCHQNIAECFAFECILGQCVGEIQKGGDCWQSVDCDPTGEFCDTATCTCEPIIGGQCTFDFQCPLLDVGFAGVNGDLCITNVCDNGICNATILKEGKCFNSDQCLTGQLCDTSTCSCVTITDTCASGYNLLPLPPPVTIRNLFCGYGIAINSQFAVEICVDDTIGSFDPFVLEAYARVNGEWFWTDELVLSTLVDGIPSLDAGAIAIWDNRIAVVTKTATDPQPSSSFLNVVAINNNGMLVNIQTELLPQTSEIVTGVDIWNRTIVAVNDFAWVYDEIAIDLWNLTQTFNETQSFVDASIFETSLALSLDRPTSLDDSWISYMNIAGFWTELARSNPVTFNGTWLSAVNAINEPSSPDYEFMVYSVPTEVPILVTDIYTATNVPIQLSKYIGATSRGFIESFRRSVVIGDNLFVDSLSETRNFQQYFQGFSIVDNTLWVEDVAFIVDFGAGNYTGYVNWCPPPGLIF